MALSVLNRKCGSSWRRSASRRAWASWLVSWIACSRRDRSRSEYARATPVATTPSARTSELKKPNQSRMPSPGPPPRPPRPPRERLTQLAADQPEQRGRGDGDECDDQEGDPAIASATATLEIHAPDEREQDRRDDRPAERLDRGDDDSPARGGGWPSGIEQPVRERQETIARPECRDGGELARARHQSDVARLAIRLGDQRARGALHVSSNRRVRVGCGRKCSRPRLEGWAEPGTGATIPDAVRDTRVPFVTSIGSRRALHAWQEREHGRGRILNRETAGSAPPGVEPFRSGQEPLHPSSQSLMWSRCRDSSTRTKRIRSCPSQDPCEPCSRSSQATRDSVRRHRRCALHGR